MGLHYLALYVCSAAAAAASCTANLLPTYHSVILLFTNPEERENVCATLPSEMIIYLQMPPTNSHKPLLRRERAGVKRQRESGRWERRRRDV